MTGTARELSVGIVGPGAIGRTHAQAVAAIEGARVSVICKGNASLAAAAAPGARWFADVDTMLRQARPDIVAIATPGGAHYRAARNAMLAGCHVVVEKPLCVDPGEAARLVGLARRHAGAHTTISQRRLEPQHLHLKEHLAAGALGRPLLIEAQAPWFRSDAYYAERPWRATVEHGGGSLLNQGVHSLDLVLWLFGEVVEVAAFGGTLGHRGLAVEDTTVAVLSFANGAKGTLLTTTAARPGYVAELRLYTDRGGAAFAQDQVTRWDFAGVPPPPAGAAIAGGGSDPAAIGIAGHIAQWRDVIAAVREGRRSAITLQDGCDAVRVAAAIYRAMQERRVVALAEFPAVIDEA